MISKLPFYDNLESHGVIIPWDKARSEWRKLHVPDEFYDATKPRYESCKWSVLLSERSVGKTTSEILLAMVLYSNWGIQSAYIRDSEEMLAPINASQLFGVIQQYQNGVYVLRATHDRWNSVYIKDRKVFFCNREDNGEIYEKSEEPWMFMLSLDRAGFYKSSLNIPRCDFLMFDEFVNVGRYREDAFILLMDVLSTVIRSRISPVVVMLANTISPNSLWFRELEIAQQLKKMKVGNTEIVTTEKGTNIYVELIGKQITRHKTLFNRLFLGFQNPKLAAITGGEEAWSFDIVPHILKEDSERIISRRLKIDTGVELLGVDFVQNSIGLCAYVHPVTKTYDDSIILTCEEIRDSQHQFANGNGKHARLLWLTLRKNQIYFSDNATGTSFNEYVRRAKLLVGNLK